ncbi:MAG: hypothetical protein RL358_192 [Pseudomonadota bacterium]|jgi:hypothetical protein
MKHAKFFALTSFVLLLGYGAVGFYFLPLAGFQGDLTRLALLPESQYGQRQNQPVIEAKLFSQAAMADADVLVIGDSFSEKHVWQTELVRQGLSVRTGGWGLQDVCSDFLPLLRGQGFHGSVVVVEIIERNLHETLKNVHDCIQIGTRANTISDDPRYPPPSNFNPDMVSWSGKLSLGVKTAFNARKYRQIIDAPNFLSVKLNNDTTLSHVKNGCELFSHRNCSASLFLSLDKAEDLAEEDLKNMLEVNKRLAGVMVIWAVVPNKSTSYFYSEKQFWNKAELRLHAPNLLRVNQQAINSRVVDLYPANNTHLSTSGYLLMGQAIYAAMQTSLLLPK